MQRPSDETLLIGVWAVWVWVDAVTDGEGSTVPGLWRKSCTCAGWTEADSIVTERTEYWQSRGGMLFRALPAGEKPTDTPDRPPVLDRNMCHALQS